MFDGLEKQFNFKPFYLSNTGAIKRIKEAIDLLKEKKPDIVIISECGLISLLVVLYCKLFYRTCKIAGFIDDSYDMIANNHHFSVKHKWAEKILLPLIDEVICVEPRVADYYKKTFGIGCYFPIIRDELLLRSELPVLQKYSELYNNKYELTGKTVFLFVGRLVSLKNIDFLIRAFIKAQLDNAKLVIVGDGTERENLVKEAQNNSNILFTGRIEGPALYAWYDVADVFILPSTMEPFGAVTNEALILGCKCLVSNIAGSNCLVEEDVNGNIFDPYDLESLVDLLRKYNHKIKRDISGYKECLMSKTFNDYYTGLVEILNS